MTKADICLTYDELDAITKLLKKRTPFAALSEEALARACTDNQWAFLCRALKSEQAIDLLEDVLSASASVRNVEGASDRLADKASATSLDLLQRAVSSIASGAASSGALTLPKPSASGPLGPTAQGPLSTPHLASALRAIHTMLSRDPLPAPGTRAALFSLAEAILARSPALAWGPDVAPAATDLAGLALEAVHEVNTLGGSDAGESLKTIDAIRVARAALALLAVSAGPADLPVAGALDQLATVAETIVTTAQTLAAPSSSSSLLRTASSELLGLAADALGAVTAVLEGSARPGSWSRSVDDSAAAADLAQRLRELISQTARVAQPASDAFGAAVAPSGPSLTDLWLALGPDAASKAIVTKDPLALAAAKCSRAASQALITVLLSAWRRGSDAVVLSSAASLGTYVSAGVFRYGAAAAAEQQALALALGSLAAALLGEVGDPSEDADRVRRATMPVFNELMLHTADETVPADVLRAAGAALADVAIESARHRGATVLPLVLDILCQTFLDPAAEAGVRAAVASGLTRLAEGVTRTGFSDGSAQQQVALRLCQTFVDASATIHQGAKPAAGRGGSQSAQPAPKLLLPALAAALGGGDPSRALPLYRQIRAHMARGPRGAADLAYLVESPEAAAQLKVLRLVWTYTAVLGLGSAPESAASLRALAACSPPLLGAQGPQQLELQLEIEERLLRLQLEGNKPGSGGRSGAPDIPMHMLMLAKMRKGEGAGSAATVRALVVDKLVSRAKTLTPAVASSSVAPSSAPLGQLAGQLAAAEVEAHRAAAGIADPGFTAVHAAYAYMTLAGPQDGHWLSALAESAMSRTLSSASELKVDGTQGTDGQEVLQSVALLVIGHLVESGKDQADERAAAQASSKNGTSSGTVSSNNIAALEALAGAGATASAARPSPKATWQAAPRIRRASADLLARLLARCPALLYDTACLRALMEGTGLEPAGAAREANSLAWLRAWLHEAAKSAPRAAEASLHAALGPSLSGRSSGPRLHPLALPRTSAVIEVAAEAMAAATAHGSSALPSLALSSSWARNGVRGHIARAAAGEVKPVPESAAAAGPADFKASIKAESIALLGLRSQVFGEAAGLRIGLASVPGSGQAAAAAAVTRRLLALAAATASSPEGPDRLDAADHLARAALLASAVIAESDTQALLSSPDSAQLLSATVWGPVKGGAALAVARAATGWHWASAARPATAPLLVKEAAAALLWTCERGWGFAAPYQLPAPAEFGPLPDKSPAERATTQLIEQVRLQKALVDYLGESLASLGLAGGAAGAAVGNAVLDACETLVAAIAVRPGHMAAAAALRISILNLAAQAATASVIRSRGRGVLSGSPAAGPTDRLVQLASDVVLAGLMHFAGQADSPCLLSEYCAHWTSEEADEARTAPLDCLRALDTLLSPQVLALRGSAQAPKPLVARIELLAFLCTTEADRLTVFDDPLAALARRPAEYLDEKAGGVIVPLKPHRVPEATWRRLGAAAWDADPRLALTLCRRFPGAAPLRADIEARLLRPEAAADPRITQAPESVLPLVVDAMAGPVSPAKGKSVAELLKALRPAGLEAALGLLEAEVHAAGGGAPGGDGKKGKKEPPSHVKRAAPPSGPLWDATRAYVLACLNACDPERVSFYLPQLVQALRTEGGEAKGGSPLEEFLLAAASRSGVFAHMLLWALETEARPPEEAFNPEIKRSGWEPPRDTGLWDIVARIQARLSSALPPAAVSYVEREMSWLASITGISGKMKKIEPELRKEEITRLLKEANAGAPQVPPGDPEYLYLPVNPKLRVLKAIPESGAVMQSAAKFPVLAAFEVVQETRGGDAAGAADADSRGISFDGEDVGPSSAGLAAPSAAVAAAVAAVRRAASAARAGSELAEAALAALGRARLSAPLATSAGPLARLEPTPPAALHPADAAELRVQAGLGALESQLGPNDALGLDGVTAPSATARELALGMGAASIQTRLGANGTAGPSSSSALDTIADLQSSGGAGGGVSLATDPGGISLATTPAGTAGRRPLNQKTQVQACIFKVGDDCRQDVLALQVIAMLRGAFRRAGLDLFLYPYGVVPTGYERGVIEVVPDTRSRSSLGETADGGLLDIFVRQFGAPGTGRFEAARRNFLRSLAGYAVASYILQSKDRHNGNILIDSRGHIIHIDFGFILEISPGGNLGFETAHFKLSHEMTQLVDPGRSRRSEEFREFESLCIRGFLAARGVAADILSCVSLMASSGLPCFGYGHPLENLRERFKLEMSDRQAARFMRGTVLDAYDKWTTRGYDVIQKLQQGILS